MEAVMLCDAFGWTYQQFCEQPNWFIELLLRKKKADKDAVNNKS